MRATAQSSNNLRNVTLVVTNDTVTLDTLSIVPGTLQAYHNRDTIELSKIYIDYIKARIYVPALLYDTLILKYRVFPIFFEKKYKNAFNIKKDSNDTYVISPFQSNTKESVNIFDFGDMNYSGNYTRGFSLGNAQDLTFNSNFNLQLTGKLQDIEIEAALTDNNIPFQPEGNTQQLQDFDKIYIQLKRKSSVIRLGDMDLIAPIGLGFLRYTKRVQGLQITTTNTLLKNTTMSNQAAYTMARGKFTRNKIANQEGNQGPYKLKGENGELFIIIVAGSEQVYMDGQLLQRGEDADYVIDYNIGELRFTPRILITKDKRIEIQFQYTDRNYLRSIFTTNHTIRSNRWQLDCAYYREHDHKNQSLLGALSSKQLLALQQVGDSTRQALVSTLDSIAFTPDRIMYAITDTTIGVNYYDTIFVYSIDPSIAHYTLTFSYVGLGHGNYIRDVNAANGTVYKWVAPLGTTPQGEYEPVSTLIAPNSHQVINTKISYNKSKHNVTYIDAAISIWDPNLYSDIHDTDNKKLSLTIGHKQHIALNPDSSWYWLPTAQFTYIAERFKEVEYFRVVEFGRDWSLTSNIEKDQQWYGLIQNEIQYNTKFKVLHLYEILNIKNHEYIGHRNSINLLHDAVHWRSNIITSWLIANDSLRKISFARPSADIAYKLNKYQKIGILGLQEKNMEKSKINDTLTPASFQFYKIKLYAKRNAEKFSYSIDAGRRYDYVLRNNDFSIANFANEINHSLKWQLNHLDLATQFSYRDLVIKDTALTKSNVRTIAGSWQIDYRAWKGMLQLNNFYQINNGQEQKLEYRYIQVPPGQGQYIWLDSLFNNNGIPEVNEFIIPATAFAFQANYIRVTAPSNVFVGVSQVQCNQTLSFIPRAYFSAMQSNLAKFFTRFSYNFQLQYLNRVDKSNDLLVYIPFTTSYTDTSSKINNMLLRNTLNYNKSDSKFTADITYLILRNKTMLIHGADNIGKAEWQLQSQYKINRKWYIQYAQVYATRYYSSEAFLNKNYKFIQQDFNPIIQWQPNALFRWRANYMYRQKININHEQLFSNKIECDIKFASLDKGSLNINASYVSVNYNDSNNDPLSYAMLEGLQRGDNYLWTVAIDRRIFKNFILNITYDGRKTGDSKIIHIARMQLSALF